MVVKKISRNVISCLVEIVSLFCHLAFFYQVKFVWLSGFNLLYNQFDGHLVELSSDILHVINNNQFDLLINSESSHLKFQVIYEILT